MCGALFQIAMITIQRATVNDVELLSPIGKDTFIAAHLHSASMEDLIQYADKKYAPGMLASEISDPNTVYNIVYRNGQLAGYSKIVLHSRPPVGELIVTYLDRIYLLSDYVKQGIGEALFQHNLALSKDNFDQGMWLNVWAHNERAIRFYTRHGFKVFNEVEFRISPTRANPCLQMLLVY
jgi:diamine N-acetyltransferase